MVALLVQEYACPKCGNTLQTYTDPAYNTAYKEHTEAVLVCRTFGCPERNIAYKHPLHDVLLDEAQISVRLAKAITEV